MGAAEQVRDPREGRSNLPPEITVDVPDIVFDLWNLTRDEAEAFYVQAFAQDANEPGHETLRWLARVDRYFLLTCLLGREDARRDWLFDRCRERSEEHTSELQSLMRNSYAVFCLK